MKMMMNKIWNPYEIHMEFVMTFIWNSSAPDIQFVMNSIWNSYEIHDEFHMNFIWNTLRISYEFHMKYLMNFIRNSCEMHDEFDDGIHGKCIWTPYGIHMEFIWWNKCKLGWFRFARFANENIKVFRRLHGHVSSSDRHVLVAAELLQVLQVQHCMLQADMCV